MGLRLNKDTKVSFRLKPGRDDVIIDWLESLGEHDRSYYVRESLKAYLNGQSPQVSSFTKSSAGFINPNANDASEKVELIRENKTDSIEGRDKLEENINKWLAK